MVGDPAGTENPSDARVAANADKIKREIAKIKKADEKQPKGRG